MPNNQYTFNEAAYLAANPDVAQNWYESPYQHYLQHGKAEGRNASFDVTPEFGNDPTELIKNLYGDWIYNFKSNLGGENPAIQQKLDELKEYNPKEYYSGLIGNYGQQLGWEIGQNRADRNPATEAQIMALLPEARAAGLTDQEINSILNENANKANSENVQRIANLAASGGSGFNFGKDVLPGLIMVGGAALGAYGLDTALAAGAAAGAAGGGGAAGTAGALDSTAIALGGSGGGGAFVPAAGSSFAIAPGAYGVAEGVGAGSYLTPELMGPTYGELGYTGVEGGLAGPTYGELGYTGLNQSEAIAAADRASQIAALKEGLSTAKDAYSNVNRAKQLAKLISGNGQPNAQELAQLQQASQPVQQFGGYYQMNQNPFAQSQQAITAQTPYKQHDFLAELAKESNPMPTMAELLRTKEA